VTVTGSTTTRVLDNYVGGSWTPSASSEQLDVTNPANGDVLARVPLSSGADLDAAVKSAREALPAWRDVAVIERARRASTRAARSWRAPSPRRWARRSWTRAPRWRA
jgi:acyl-CoA reductase-like NAD-dependent aldehyde dehydrogenase